MKKLSMLLILLVLFGSLSASLFIEPVRGQYDSAQSFKRGAPVAQSITSAAAGSLVPVTGYTHVEVRYSGTYTTNATAAGFQASLNGGTNWDDTAFFQRGTTNYCERLTVTGDLTDNSTNRWIVPLHGADSFRTNALNWASGTISVILVPFSSPSSPCEISNWGNPLSDAIDSIAANTEMPAAAALADNTANPTVPGVGAFLMGWDGSNWDRVPADSTNGIRVDLAGNNDVTITNTPTFNPGNTANTTAWLMTIVPRTSGGCSWHSAISAASTNATVVKSSAGQVYAIYVTNSNAAPRFIKFYNVSSPPTVGTTTVFARAMIPADPTGNGFVVPIPAGTEFTTGIAYSLTTGSADNDTGSVAAGEIIVNVWYK